MLVRTIYLSLDPYMRGRMDAGPSYAPPVEIGQVREDITDGLENAPRELIRLLKGGNFGKKIIRVNPEPA
jgi:NADPH-dependent curcumin reductase CurA